MIARSGPRYLRPDGNRRLRRRRRTRAAARLIFWMAIWLAGAGALAGTGAGIWRLLTGEGRFPLSAVILEGAPEPVKEGIMEALAPLHGRNLFALDLRELERRVMAHPWVSSASVHRRLPDAVLVILTTRKVEALVEVGGEIRMVDRTGRDLGRYEPQWADQDQPVIAGLAGDGAERGAQVAERLERGLKAIRELRQTHPDFVQAISTVDVSRRDRLTVTLRDFGPPLYLSPDAPQRNVRHLATVRNRLAAEGMVPGYLDLRFRDRIAVMPVAAGADGGASGAS